MKCDCPDCKCPCDGCPCVAICRHKTLKTLKDECELIQGYYNYPHFYYKVRKIEDALDPTSENWRGTE